MATTQITVQPGTAKKFTFTYRNEDGDLTDPTETFVEVAQPDGAQQSYQFGVDNEVARTPNVAAGSFDFVQTFEQEGVAFVGSHGTGAVQYRHEPVQVIVKDSVFVS